MDNNDALIRQLCTRAGCIMEDSSVTALIWTDSLFIDQRLERLATAADQIQAIVGAAKAIHQG
jgi:hypothetical protein